VQPRLRKKAGLKTTWVRASSFFPKPLLSIVFGSCEKTKWMIFPGCGVGNVSMGVIVLTSFGRNQTLEEEERYTHLSVEEIGNFFLHEIETRRRIISEHRGPLAKSLK
jgi:hypothetical protein